MTSDDLALLRRGVELAKNARDPLTGAGFLSLGDYRRAVGLLDELTPRSIERDVRRVMRED